MLAAALFSAPAAAGPANLSERLEACAACHGRDGTSVREGVPSLAGQPALFLTAQLIYFREGLRASEEMSPVAEPLGDAEIEALSAHFAGLAPRRQETPEKKKTSLFERGRDLARRLRCGTCHLPSYAGRQQIPRLAGQREDYLAKAMRAYRDETRGGPDTTMVDILRGIDDAGIAALAHFVSRQRGRPGGEAAPR